MIHSSVRFQRETLRQLIQYISTFHNYNGTPIIQTIQMWPEILELGK